MSIKKYSKLRILSRKIRGKHLEIHKMANCPFSWYGTHYGGFYVNSKLINSNSIIYSFGIGEDISFDLSLIEKHGCNVFGFDPTPKSIDWINNQKIPENFHFYDYGLSNETGTIGFYLPKNVKHVSGSLIVNGNVNMNDTIHVPVKKFSDILLELNHDPIDLLKMDIEGTEYDVLEDILLTNVMIKQFAIEFHHRFIKRGARKTKKAIKLLSEYDYEVFAWADSLEEISFIHKSLVS